MSDPIGWWSGLSRPWKGAIITFVASMAFFVATGFLSASPAVAIFSALLWGAAVGSYLRSQDRRRRDR